MPRKAARSTLTLDGERERERERQRERETERERERNREREREKKPSSPSLSPCTVQSPPKPEQHSGQNHVHMSCQLSWLIPAFETQTLFLRDPAWQNSSCRRAEHREWLRPGLAIARTTRMGFWGLLYCNRNQEPSRYNTDATLASAAGWFPLGGAGSTRATNLTFTARAAEVSPTASKAVRI